MILRYETIYQGPGQPSLEVRDGDVVDHCKIIQVGWSLLRNLTSFEYPPPVVLNEGDGWFCNNEIRGRGNVCIDLTAWLQENWEVLTKQKTHQASRTLGTG